MKLNPKQLWSIARATSRINIWEGAVRSGKTIATDIKFIDCVRQPKTGLPPDAKDMMIGKTIGSLKRNVIDPICNMLGKAAKYFPGKQELHIWDNVIEIVGANDERSVGKITGSTLRYVLGDELVLWPENFWIMLDTRLCLPCSQFFGTTNPGSPNHWLKKRVLNRKGELDVATFHFLLEDNPTLDDSYAEHIRKSMTGMWFKRLILGLWCIAEGAIYDFFDEDEHVITMHPEAEYYVLSMDPGFTHTFGAVLFGVNRNTKPMIWAEQEYCWTPKEGQPKKDVGEVSKEIETMCLNHLGKYWKARVRSTYIDPSHEAMQIQIEKDQFPGVTEGDNAVLPGIQTVAMMSKCGDYAIHQRCNNLIEERYSYVWDPKAQEAGKDEPLKIGDDMSDAERYAVYSEFGNYLDLNALTRM